MDLSSASSERATAIISAVVAVIILAAGVTAHQSRTASTDKVVQLESDLRFQLDVGFRHNANERTARFAQLDKVMNAWQQSAQEAKDRDLLETWLLEATIRCMPGSTEALPVAPVFGQHRTAKVVEPKGDVIVAPEKSYVAGEDQELVPTPAEAVAPVKAVVVRVNTDLEAIELPQSEKVVAEQSVVSNAFAVVAETAEAAEPVRINLTELVARIAGYHEGLDEVETALLTLDSSDLKALSRQIGQLDEMTRHFQFVHLYYESLTDAERGSIIAPRSMRATLAEIERRLDRNQEAMDGDFLGEFDANYQEQIAQLREQLAEVARRNDR